MGRRSSLVFRGDDGGSRPNNVGLPDAEIATFRQSGA
jgi:hypothetical protein